MLPKLAKHCLMLMNNKMKIKKIKKTLKAPQTYSIDDHDNSENSIECQFFEI